MEVISVQDAEIHFSELLLRVRRSGEEFIISKGGKPFAKLLPFKPAGMRVPGIAAGRVTEAFFEHLPDEELRHWE